MTERGLAIPKEDIERAANHFGVTEAQVTPEIVEALPPRGTGLERGTARGLSDEEVNRIASAVVEKAREDVGIRDVIIGSAMGKGAIPLYGRETREEPCSCCLIEPEGPNAPENRMCTTSGAIGTLKDSEEREWCSGIKIVSDGRCARARSIREAARVCKEKHPEDTEAFFRCYIPAFSQITRGSNPGADKEFASQVAEYVASIPGSTFVRMKPGVLHEPILAMAKEKGYEDGPRFVRYMKTPEGQAFYMERYRLAREARKPPARVEALTEEEKRKIIDEFKQLMGREPTHQEMYELVAEELKLKQKVLVK